MKDNTEPSPGCEPSEGVTTIEADPKRLVETLEVVVSSTTNDGNVPMQREATPRVDDIV